MSGWVKSSGCRYYGHLARTTPEEDHHRAIAAALRPPAEWRRPVGRPRATWLRTVDNDLQSLHFGVHMAWRNQEIGTFGIKSSVLQRSTMEFANKEESIGLRSAKNTIAIPHGHVATLAGKIMSLTSFECVHCCQAEQTADCSTRWTYKKRHSAVHFVVEIGRSDLRDFHREIGVMVCDDQHH